MGDIVYVSEFEHAMAQQKTTSTTSLRDWQFEGNINACVRGKLVLRAEREWAVGHQRHWIVEFESTNPEHNNQVLPVSARQLLRELPFGRVLISAGISGECWSHGHILQNLKGSDRYARQGPAGRPDEPKLPCSIPGCPRRSAWHCYRCSLGNDFFPICADSCYDLHSSTLAGVPAPRVGGHTGRHATRSFWAAQNARCIRVGKRLPCSFCNKPGCSRYCHLCSDANNFVVICDKCARAAATAAAAEDVSEAGSVAPARTKRRRDGSEDDTNPYAREYNTASKRARSVV